MRTSVYIAQAYIKAGIAFVIANFAGSISNIISEYAPVGVPTIILIKISLLLIVTIASIYSVTQMSKILKKINYTLRIIRKRIIRERIAKQAK